MKKVQFMYYFFFLGYASGLTAQTNPKCLSGDCYNGFGTYVWANGNSYTGNWSNGRMAGKGTFCNRKGIVTKGSWSGDELLKVDTSYNFIQLAGMFTGTLKENKKSGTGKYYLSDGSIIEGKWENNQIAGNAKITSLNGNIYEGEIKDSVASGKGKTTYINGATYEGAYENGMPNGKGKYFRMIEEFKLAYKREFYEGNWKDGFEDGYGVYTWESKQWGYIKEKQENTYKGNWTNGIKNGIGVYTWKSSIHKGEDKYEGNWKNGMMDGQGTYSWSTGGKFEGLWEKNNKLYGKSYDYKGNINYIGGEKEAAAYNKKVEAANKQVLSEAAIERERNPSKACKCDFCGGNGKTRFKSAKTWETPVYENGKEVGTATKFGWEFEDVTCTKCLGTGKCK